MSTCAELASAVAAVAAQATTPAATKAWTIQLKCKGTVVTYSNCPTDAMAVLLPGGQALNLVIKAAAGCTGAKRPVLKSVAQTANRFFEIQGAGVSLTLQDLVLDGEKKRLGIRASAPGKTIIFKNVGASGWLLGAGSGGGVGRRSAAANQGVATGRCWRACSPPNPPTYHPSTHPPPTTRQPPRHAEHGAGL